MIRQTECRACGAPITSTSKTNPTKFCETCRTIRKRQNNARDVRNYRKKNPMPRTPGPLSDRDVETLRALKARADAATDTSPWFTPMDMGGSDSSHHSKTLRKLADRRLAKLRKRIGASSTGRGANTYQISAAGVAFLRDMDAFLKESGKYPR
jgi:hypothetical protein